MSVFTLTIAAASALTYLLFYFSVSQNYQKQLLFSAGQSFEQSYRFLEDRLDTLRSAADVIYYNEDVSKGLTKLSDLGSQTDLAAQYRGMYQLQDILYSYFDYQQDDLRISLYVPDSLVFSQQQACFFSMSSLTGNQRILNQPERDVWLSPENIPFASDTPGEKRVSFLRKIVSSDNVKNIVGLLRVSLPASVFEKILAKSNITQRGAVLIFDPDENVLAGSGEATLKQMGLGPKGKNWSLLHTDHSWDVLTLGGGNYYAKTATLENTGWKFAVLIPTEELMWQVRRINQILLFVLCSLIAAACVFSYRFSRRFTMRIRTLSRQMEAVKWGSLEGSIENHDTDEVGRLTDHFNDMMEELRTYQRQVLEKGKALRGAELNALQAQINPHFLYNTLDLINWEALENDAPEIAEISCALAKFYKLSLNHGKDIVPIADEVEHATLYVNIQNWRYDSRIRLEVDVPEPLRKALIPKLVLQPLVENSIQHGLLEKMDDRTLGISIAGREETNEADNRHDILLIVRDDGAGMAPEKLANILQADSDRSHGYGVQNVHRRLRLSFGEPYGLSYRSTPGKGTEATIRIPFQTGDEKPA